jgi:predicted GIY-YIG superfamily endonuclease
MVRYHYVDVLLSQKEGLFYAGCTQNVLKRHGTATIVKAEILAQRAILRLTRTA